MYIRLITLLYLFMNLFTFIISSYNPILSSNWAKNCWNNDCDLCNKNIKCDFTQSSFINAALYFGNYNKNNEFVNFKSCSDLYIKLNNDEKNWEYVGNIAPNIIDGDIVIMNGGNECCIGTSYGKITCYNFRVNLIPYQPINAIYRYKNKMIN